MPTRISVIIPTHNRLAIIGKAIRSVLNQDIIAKSKYSLEVIVVDDGSSDGTIEELPKQFPAVRLLRNEVPQGGAAARDKGAEQAEGAFLAFLDSDDEWLPHHLSTSIRQLESGTYAFSISQFYLSDGQQDRQPPFISASEAASRHLPDALIGLPRFDTRTSTFVFRREAYFRTRFDPTVAKHQDWDLFVRANCTHRLSVHYIDEPTVRISVAAGLSRMSHAYNLPASYRFIVRNRSCFSKRAISIFWLKIARKLLHSRSYRDLPTYISYVMRSLLPAPERPCRR